MKHTKCLLALLLAAILALGLGAPAFADGDLPDSEEPAILEEQSIVGGFIADIVWWYVEGNEWVGAAFRFVTNLFRVGSKELTIFFPVYLFMAIAISPVFWPIYLIYQLTGWILGKN